MAFTVDAAYIKDSRAVDGEDGITVDVTYVVLFSGGTFDPVALLSSGLVPNRNDDYPTSSQLYAKETTTELADGMATPPTGLQGVATYTVHYETKNLGGNAKEIHPLSRPADISWGGAEITEVRRYDVDGNALCNSAGQFFEDLPEFFIRGGEVRITQNEAANPATKCVTYSYTTNDGTWYGVAAGNALIGKIEADKVTETYDGNEITYWRVSYPIAFRRDGWGFKTYDIGYKYLDDNDELICDFDKNGTPTPTPVKLDGNGGRLSDQTANAVEWPTTPATGFKVYEESDFASLSIANPFL
jgi:hypothetical protein